MPRRPTSADVASEAGVSRTTVSFVMNGRTDIKIPPETRQRVLSAAERLGYHPHSPARQLAAGRSHVIGLVLRQTPEQIAGDAVLVDTLRGLASAARTEGFRVLVEPLPPNGPESSFEALLRSQHADGLVISGPRTDDPSLLALAGEDFPIVIQGNMPGLSVASVDVDNVAGARRAVEHLLGLGHRRIACITNAAVVYTAAQDRLAGYRTALGAAGLPALDELIEEGAFDAPSGHAAMKRLLARTTFDAVFVASDVVALGAIGALREAGRRVPADVSVVGFDDIPLAAYFDPPLTTVRLPAYELGQAAGRALLDRIAERSIPSRTLLPTELIVRGSTATPSSQRLSTAV
ncbi:MAG TPA: LacI family DNA-binding transcriptional regulator [Candidatus Limnocylindrales bacterium]|nr:LacI family DNA-binding transcriptional regulator [Candidatus Limnocylindrales bacterium]